MKFVLIEENEMTSGLKQERWLQVFLKFNLLLLLLISFVLIFLFTLSVDEAWLIDNFRDIYTKDTARLKIAPLSLTNGGIYVLVGIVLYSIFGLVIWPYRILSFLSLCVIIYILWIWSQERWKNQKTSLIVPAVFLGVWGTVELGALSLAEMPATLLLLLGLNFLMNSSESKHSFRSLLVSGIFFGFAASSRMNFVVIFPALFLEALFVQRNKYRVIGERLIICSIGILVLSICHLIVILISPESVTDLLSRSFRDSGLQGAWIDYPRILNKWVVANGFLPLYLMMAVSLFAIFDASSNSQLFRILVIFGWVHWLSWLFRAPIPHLRYFWPTLMAFGITGGFALGDLYRRAQNTSLKGWNTGILLVVLGFSIMGMINGFRSLLIGDSNIISWEWSRESPLSTFRWIRYKPNQDKMAAYLKKTVESQEIGILGMDLGMGILSGIDIIPLSHHVEEGHWTSDPLPRKILISPLIGHYLYMDPGFWNWAEKNLQKEVQFGHYVLYKVSGNYPQNPKTLKTYHTPNPYFPQTEPFDD